MTFKFVPSAGCYQLHGRDIVPNMDESGLLKGWSLIVEIIKTDNILHPEKLTDAEMTEYKEGDLHVGKLFSVYYSNSSVGHKYLSEHFDGVIKPKEYRDDIAGFLDDFKYLQFIAEIRLDKDKKNKHFAYPRIISTIFSYKYLVGSDLKDIKSLRNFDTLSSRKMAELIKLDSLNKQGRIANFESRRLCELRQMAEYGEREVKKWEKKEILEELNSFIPTTIFITIICIVYNVIFS